MHDPIRAQNLKTIVSGGAFGVDVEAQKLALEYDGKVITVLGSGLNKPAPKTNMQFFKKVEKKGLLVSQFEADVHATKYTFPQRNELISGLSDMVLIIEARKKSGALITADFAIDQGKPVGCFPGRVTDELSYGTNKLLQQGAHLITCTRDILEIMGIANNKPKKQNAVQQTLSEIYN